MAGQPLSSAPPQIAQPIVNPDGTPTASFFKLLLALWMRTGSATGQLIGFINTDGTVLSAASVASAVINEIEDDPELLAQLAALVVSSGFMLPFAGTEAMIPTGWLLCNGQAVSRSAFAALYAAIGTKYGIGDGVVTFNLPNMPADLPFNLNLRLLPILATFNWLIKT